jgi:hypothetical protein
MELQGEIRSIRSEIRMLATQVSGCHLKTLSPKRAKRTLKRIALDAEKRLRILRTKANSVKAFACAECGCSLYSRQSDGAFLLSERKPTEKKLACPDCGFEGTLALDPVHGGTADFECAKCHSLYRAVRRAKDVNLRPVKKSNDLLRWPEISEELLGRIRVAMGPQPWPSGRARDVAAQLGIARAITHRAVEQLIARGDFRLQLNGRIYEPTGTVSKG